MKLPSIEKLLAPFDQKLFWAALAAVCLHGFRFASVRGAVLVMFIGTQFCVFWGFLPVLVDS